MAAHAAALFLWHRTLVACPASDGCVLLADAVTTWVVQHWVVFITLVLSPPDRVHACCMQCADVRITDAARMATGVEEAEWSKGVQLQSGKWGDYRVVRMNEDVQARDAAKKQQAAAYNPGNNRVQFRQAGVPSNPDPLPQSEDELPTPSNPPPKEEPAPAPAGGPNPEPKKEPLTWQNMPSLLP
jgi:hypothetical protein